MNPWFYAEDNRQRRGPVSSEELIALYRSDRIAADTLVWREGMAQWQPLAEFAEELGLAAVAEPTTAFATPQPVGSPPPVSGPLPRRGLSGCAIAALIAAVCGLLLVLVLTGLAIFLAAAYQGYATRARVAEVYREVSLLKPRVQAFHAAQGRCPVNGDDGFGTADSYADGHLDSVRIGRFDNGHCGLEAVFAWPHRRKIDGKALWLDLDPASGQWRCSAEIRDKYLPRECRG